MKNIVIFLLLIIALILLQIYLSKKKLSILWTYFTKPYIYPIYLYGIKPDVG